MIQFQDINENGTTKRINPESPFFSFEYSNPFYGSCSFIAKVTDTHRGSLILEEGSIDVKNFDLNKGTLSALVASARNFFKHHLNRFSSLDALENGPVAEKKTLDSSRPFLFLRTLGIF